MARQDHYSNGSVLLSFDVYMMNPKAGESGTLTAAVQDGSGPWTVSKNVSFPTTGENNATMQVQTFPLDPLLQKPRSTVLQSLPASKKVQ